MKNKGILLTVGLLLAINLGQQFWTSAQWTLPMVCSDEKESCIWYTEDLQHQLMIWTLIMTVLSILTFVLLKTFPSAHQIPLPRFQHQLTPQRQRILRE